MCLHIRDLVHQLLNLLQLHGCGVALHDVSDCLGVPLQAADQFFVRRRHPAALKLRHLVLQTSRLIGQLADHTIPHGKALVAGLTVGELALVASGALVAAWARHALPAGAVAGRSMALLAGDSPRVAVTSWEHGDGGWGEESFF